MTRSEFEELLTYHDDIELVLDEFEFTVLTYSGKYDIGTATENYKYDTIDEVLDNYKINSIPLREKLDDLILYTCA